MGSALLYLLFAIPDSIPFFPLYVSQCGPSILLLLPSAAPAPLLLCGRQQPMLAPTCGAIGEEPLLPQAGPRRSSSHWPNWGNRINEKNLIRRPCEAVERVGYGFSLLQFSNNAYDTKISGKATKTPVKLRPG